MSKAERYRALERWGVVLISIHSLAVGFFLLFLTEWGVAFGGWGAASPLFFPRQAGIFHFVVAIGYLSEYFRYRGVTLLLSAKLIAVLFLSGTWLLSGGPWAVPLSAVADGFMGLAMWIIHRKSLESASGTAS